MKRLLRDAIEIAAVVLLLTVLLNTVVDRRQVDGPSMDPTLHGGQRVVANKLAYSPFVSQAFAALDPNDSYDHPGTPHRGDIVVLKRPGQADSPDLVKRVIGLPGETIEVRAGTVYINGRALAEPYVVHEDAGWLPPTRIPPGYVFVMGDNRTNSLDSRSFGPVAINSLLGKVWLRYWPLTDVSLLAAP